MRTILVECDGIGNFDGHAPDFYLDAGRLEHGHELLVKVRDRPRHERNGLQDSFAGFKKELMAHEVKPDFDGAVAAGHARRGESARGDVERNVPPMIDERRERKTNLAHDLRVQMQRGAGV